MLVWNKVEVRVEEEKVYLLEQGLVIIITNYVNEGIRVYDSKRKLWKIPEIYRNLFAGFVPGFDVSVVKDKYYVTISISNVNIEKQISLSEWKEVIDNFITVFDQDVHCAYSISGANINNIKEINSYIEQKDRGSKEKDILFKAYLSVWEKKRGEEKRRVKEEKKKERETLISTNRKERKPSSPKREED